MIFINPVRRPTQDSKDASRCPASHYDMQMQRASTKRLRQGYDFGGVRNFHYPHQRRTAHNQTRKCLHDEAPPTARAHVVLIERAHDMETSCAKSAHNHTRITHVCRAMRGVNRKNVTVSIIRTTSFIRTYAVVCTVHAVL